MEPSTAFLSLFVQVFCLLLILGLVLLAGRAVVVERSAGLRPSYRRLTIIVTLTGLLLGMAVLELQGMSEGLPGPEAPLVQAETLAQKKQRLKELKQQCEKLQDEINKLEQLPAKPITDKNTGRESPKREPFINQASLVKWMAPAAIVVALLCLLFLFLTGESSTLWPALLDRLRGRLRINGERAEDIRLRTLAALEGLTEAARHRRYADGIAQAEKVRLEVLNRLEGLDFLFLRAHCIVGKAAETPEKAPSESEREATRATLRRAVDDLTSLIEQAPNLGEADYLLGLALTLLAEHERALDVWRQAELKLEGAGLPIDQNKSVCLLMVAEKRLGQGDADGANALFDEVTRLGVLTRCIPGILLENRLLHVRETLRRGQLEEVQEGIKLVRQIGNLSEAEQRIAAVTCDVFEVLSRFQSGKLLETLERLQELLRTWGPKELPDLDDQTADEYLFPAIDAKSLALPAEFFRALYFLHAVTMAQIAARTKQGAMDDSTVAELREPLLRALQFEPRHREVLAALSGLYYWFLPLQRQRAIAWMEAAVQMGVPSPTVRRILEHARQIEVERRDLLQRFLTVSGRFLSDPGVSLQVRKALREELGRFQEFQPLLVEVDQDTVGETSPTLSTLQARARYVDELLNDVLRRGDPARSPELHALKQHYVMIVSSVERSANDLLGLERQVMEAVGKAVLY